MIERRRQIQILLQLVGDVLATGAAFFVAYWLRFEVEVQPVTKGLPPLYMYLRLVPVVTVLWSVCPAPARRPPRPLSLKESIRKFICLLRHN